MTSAIPYFMILLEMITAALNQNQVKIETAKAALEKANSVWLQCFAHCCWIHFYLHTEDGTPAVYALDPKGVPATYENDDRIVHPPRRGKIRVTETIDLTQFLDNQNSKNITLIKQMMRKSSSFTFIVFTPLRSILPSASLCIVFSCCIDSAIALFTNGIGPKPFSFCMG